MMKLNRYILITLFMGGTHSFAQEKLAVVKQHIGTHLSRMEQFRKNSEKDSLLAENKNLTSFLERSLAKDATLMSADMTDLAAMGLGILSSVDGKLKIYQWKSGFKDTINGIAGETEMYVDNYRAIAAYKTDKGISTTVLQEIAEQQMRYDSLLSVAGKDKTYYLLISNGVDKMDNKVMKMQAFFIDGNTLNSNANIFSSSGSSVNNVSIAYSRNSPAPGKMALNKETGTLAISSPGNIKKALVYRFDGHTFVQQRNP